MPKPNICFHILVEKAWFKTWVAKVGLMGHFCLTPSSPLNEPDKNIEIFIFLLATKFKISDF